ncbi:hypothetical protein KSS87_020610 [Heliosperma pusillum]|nr:hypothetical protein KSS87_020610 [Heliosperma pusillum]
MGISMKITERLPFREVVCSSPLSHRGSPKLRVLYLRQHRKYARMCVKITSSLDSYDSVSRNGAAVVLPAAKEYTREAIQSIKSGKVIAVPTDTIYGFSCDACSREAVNRIYEIKGRKLTSPLAICVGDVPDVIRFAVTHHLPESLLETLLPGPVTVVLRRVTESILEYQEEVVLEWTVVLLKKSSRVIGETDSSGIDGLVGQPVRSEKIYLGYARIMIEVKAARMMQNKVLSIQDVNGCNRTDNQAIDLEIKEAIFSIPALGSPVPAGYTSQFFRDAFEIFQRSSPL